MHQRLLNYFCFSASLMALSACATLEGFKADLTPQATEVVKAATLAPDNRWVEPVISAMPSTDWVSDFSDPILNALVAEALSANTDISAQQASFEAALARIKISDADRKPSVSGSAGLSRTENVNDLLTDRTSFSNGVNASWEADLFGRIKDQVGSSEYSALASGADLASVRLAIAGRVVQNWFDVLESRLLTELSERDVETQERAERLTLRRFEGGITGSSDVRLARSSVANAKALQASRRQRLAQSTRALEVLLRRYPENALQSGTDLPPLPTLPGVGVPSEILQSRPDLIAADFRLAAAGLDVDVAKKNLLPRLTLDGGLNASATSFSDFFDIDSLIANIGAGLTAPIFQGGRLKANVELQEAFLRQQLKQYTGSVLVAYGEVENALNAERFLTQQVNALQTALEEALKAEERLEIRYTEGLATILQLLDAQSRRISSEGQLISARSERLDNRVRLYLALGGGDVGSVNNIVEQVQQIR